MSHEVRRLIREDTFYPDHAPRQESAVFRRTKAEGHQRQLPCAISGQRAGTEYHHLFVEWADCDAIDWPCVKAIGTGEITELPVLDLVTDQPTGETYSVEHSLIWMVCKLAELRGFDWHAFDPAKPEMFVDSMANMLVLQAKFHRGKGHGIHESTFPVWIFQAYPRIGGFVYSPDEVPAPRAPVAIASSAEQKHIEMEPA